MIYLYGHSGSGNHGCEAIVRSTESILHERLKLFSYHGEQDTAYGLEQICKVERDVNSLLKRGSWEWFLSSIQTKLTGNIDLAMRFRKKNLLQNVSRGDLFLSIGGDNYCYAGTDILAAVNRNLRRKGARLVLWGCSVEPALLEQPEIAKDLASFDLITARETISYEALKKVNPNTVLVADPAFALQRKDIELPEGWQEGNTIGINASPLILESSGDGSLVLDAYKKLIKHILDMTDSTIALIPHVVWEGNDDRVILQTLYNEFSDTGRVLLIGDHNCMELKGLIARCRMFIGARTHATIAAYSSCVPTLVLGYSVKSKGIAQDLFGTEENYVFPVQNLSDANELARGYAWLEAHEQEIREHLKNIMPDYIKRAELGCSEVMKLKNS